GVAPALPGAADRAAQPAAARRGSGLPLVPGLTGADDVDRERAARRVAVRSAARTLAARARDLADHEIELDLSRDGVGGQRAEIELDERALDVALAIGAREHAGPTAVCVTGVDPARGREDHRVVAGRELIRRGRPEESDDAERDYDR